MVEKSFSKLIICVPVVIFGIFIAEFWRIIVVTCGGTFCAALNNINDVVPEYLKGEQNSSTKRNRCYPISNAMDVGESKWFLPNFKL